MGLTTLRVVLLTLGLGVWLSLGLTRVLPLRMLLTRLLRCPRLLLGPLSLRRPLPTSLRTAERSRLLTRRSARLLSRRCTRLPTELLRCLLRPRLMLAGLLRTCLLLSGLLHSCLVLLRPGLLLGRLLLG